MKYAYYNHNLTFVVGLKSLFLTSSKAENIIKKYFTEITGKEYIIVTNSCRTALYLAYKSINNTGEVITSPLTCKVAIDPIEESSNKPVYADVNIGDLNINTKDIEHRITENTIAIQAIHLGGVSCDMEGVNNIAKRYNLWVIEDCAQSLGAKYKNKYSGSFGDISCFSLIKNAYGIGGGILATNSVAIFRKALKLNKELGKPPVKLIIFRFIRNIAETYRETLPGQCVIKLLLKIKDKNSSYKSVQDQLNRISLLQLNVSALQIARLDKLHKKRKFVGKTYYRILNNNGVLCNSNYDVQDCSFTKFFVYNPRINTKETINKLSISGIETMHLEHKQGSPYQEKLVFENELIIGLKNYSKVHDNIISLPINESHSKEEVYYIINTLYQSLDE